MESCKECLFYNKMLSEFMEMHQDSTPVKEKPKKHFCIVFSDGIPDEYWSDEKRCPYFIGRESK